MTNQTHTNPDSEIERVLTLFDGGIHGKGSEKGGYPTYFYKPYPLWAEDRKQIARKKLLSLKHQWQNEAIDHLTKNWNNYIGDMPDKKKDELGYLELTGMLWGCAMTTKERLANSDTREEIE